ncbi:HAD family hydrolase [Winogradskyella luteola]|uniref:HAD family hydrolase n=1 Tax=Winogradskyella luteola TaxID=2828330 RepID=A0A9X1F6I2_9FLAO|nr:HAD family hydrolase [Winogradskyella luteola]MBV7268154.1 HAD family hydrolase [Winogradskyella luteola]
MDIKVNTNTVVVFDLDDTLYNELDFLKSAYQYIAQKLEVKNHKSLYINMFSLYRNNKNVFKLLSSEYNVEIQLLIDMYRNHIPNIELFEGAMEMINSVKAKQGKIGIITDGRSKTQRAKINALGITDLVDKVIISEDIGTEKPNINNFRIIESEFPNCNYWYIADNLKKDFISPNQLGWNTLGLIDNGKNIHYASHKYMDVEHKPLDFILNLSDIKIV